MHIILKNVLSFKQKELKIKIINDLSIFAYYKK